jgi:hypothetical protein
LSRFKGAAAAATSLNEDKFVISDDEDGENGTTVTWRATSVAKTQQPQQQPSPPTSPDNRRAPRQGLAGLVASGKITPTKTAKASTTTPPSMSFSDAINKAKATTDETAATEKARLDGPNSSRTTPSPPKTQPRGAGGGGNGAAAADDEEEDEDEDVLLRIPGSFDFEGSGDGGAAGAIEDPYDAVAVLGSLWRRMQLSR